MRALGKVFFGEMKFVLSNFLSNEDLSVQSAYGESAFEELDEIFYIVQPK